MELRRKKIIAREFLILMGCIGMGFVFYGSTFLYNAYFDHKKSSIEKDRTQKQIEISDLRATFEKKQAKQSWFFDQEKQLFDLDFPRNTENIKVVWTYWENLEQHDSIPIYYDKIWNDKTRKLYGKIGFGNSKALSSFIRENMITKEDQEHLSKANQVGAEENALWSQYWRLNAHILSQEEQLQYTLRASLYLLFVAFPLRFLINAIRWSIRVVRQKE